MKNITTIPTGWSIKTFENCFDVATKISGLKKTEYRASGKYPVIDQGQDFITAYSDEDQLLQTRAPSIVFGDHTRVLKYIDFPHILGNDGTKVLLPKKEYNPKILYYLLSEIEVPNTGYNRHFKYLEDVKLKIPSRDEQEKIAEVLSSVDEDIEKTDAVIRQTEKLKKGLMQELFTKGIGHTKFKKTKLGEIPEEWKLSKLKDASLEIIDGDRGENYPKQSDFLQKGFCLFLNNKNIKQDTFSFNEMQFISQEKDDKLRKGKLKRYDCVLTTRGTVGTVAYYDIAVQYENIRINSGMVIFRAMSDLFSGFLYQLLKSDFLKERYRDMSSGSAQPQLPIGSLEDIMIAYPASIDEQKKIASMLVSVDEKISITKKNKEKLIQLKKGLMSDLLSGKVRT